MIRLLHGTSESHADNIAAHGLDADAASQAKREGPPGFYAAEQLGDAQFFAAAHSEPAIVVIRITDAAFNQLLDGGASLQPIPGGHPPYWNGREFWLPVELFEQFNDMRHAELIQLDVKRR